MEHSHEDLRKVSKVFKEVFFLGSSEYKTPKELEKAFMKELTEVMYYISSNGNQDEDIRGNCDDYQRLLKHLSELTEQYSNVLHIINCMYEWERQFKDD